MSIDWTAVSAIATGIAASVTAWMAITTKKSLQQAEKFHEQSASQARQYHQNGFRPICVLENHYGPDDPYRREDYLMVKLCGENELLISAQLKLKNIGSGPALCVRMILLFPHNNPDAGYFVELIPLPANGEYCNEKNYIIGGRGEGPADSEYGNEKTPIQIRMTVQNYEDRKFGFRLPSGQESEIPIDAFWEIVLKYEDVFGNKFHTVHTKDALHPWTKVGGDQINLPVSIRKEIEHQEKLEHLPRMNQEISSVVQNQNFIADAEKAL